MSRAPAEPATLIDLLARQAAADPSRVVYTILADDAENTSLRCDALWRQSRALAAALQPITTAGDRVMLLYPTGLSFIISLFGSISAGLIPVPAPPLDPNRRARTLPRVLSMVRDARPSLVLHESSLQTDLDALQTEVPELGTLAWRTIDELVPYDQQTASWAETWSPPAIDGDDLAYLQYTSGSTASPKGVMVRHGNLLHNARLIKDAWRYDRDSIDLSWVPNFHDDGIVHAILEPLYCGGRSILMGPAAFIGRPIRWLEAISRYRATHSGGPDFAYALATRKTDPDQRQGLDLSSWRLAYNAAEPVRPQTLDAFADAFAPHGFAAEALFPSFGLAESTLLVTTAAWDRKPTYFDLDPEIFESQGRTVAATTGGRRMVGCGKPVIDTEVVIVDPRSCRQRSADHVGEIWIRGGSVAAGYWRRPAATARTFDGRLRDERKERDHERGNDPQNGGFLRTGDLGFLHDGELFITGRIKDLMIVRGRNIYPQDIEQTVAACHPALRPGCGAAFSLDRGGEERLVMVQEASDRSPLNIGAVAETVRQRLAATHDVQLETLVVIRPRTIAKTSSGKIQRHACKAAFVAGELAELGRWPDRSADVAPRDGSLASVQSWLRRFLGESIDWHLADTRRSLPANVILELGQRGLLGLQASRDDGGLGLSHGEVVRVLQQLGAIDLTLATFVVGHNALGLRPIQRAATTAVRQRLVPQLARGQGLAAFALSESGAGSNPRALAAVAVPDGDGWRLYGEKRWIGSAAWATVINVFAQRLDERGQRCGIIGLAVSRNAEGLRIGAEARTLGLRGMTQNIVTLDGVRVTADDLLGKPDEGMAVAEDAMRFTRFCLAAISVGGTQRCLQLMLRYASRRTIATGRLLDNPVTRARLTETIRELETVEALVLATAEAFDGSAPVPDEIFAVLKVAGPELLWRTADRLVQLLGGRGYEENNIAPRLLRDARVFRIFEGPTEALQLWLGASVEHDAQALGTFLRTRLGATAAADALRDVRKSIIDHLVSDAADRVTDRVATRQWMHSLLGEVTIAAVLWAAVEGSEDPARRAAAGWSRKRFDELVARATSTTFGDADRLDATALIDAITQFETGIGDPDEAPSTPPLDALLVRVPEASTTADAATTPAPTSPPTSPTLSAPSQAQENTDPSSETSAAIEAWLVAWCGEELGVGAAAIDVNTNFVNLGLTSVTAVTLADQLGTWLDRAIERTLVWQYPTIATVARFLGGGPPATAGSASAPTATAATTAAASDDELLRQLLDDVERLSDDEARSTLQAGAHQQGADDGSG